MDDDLDKLLNQAVRLSMQDKPAEAIKLFRRILTIDPHHYGAMHGMGILRAKAGQPDEAFGPIGGAIAMQPDHVLAHYNQGRILGDMNRQQEALAGYGKAILLRPDFAEAHNNRALLLRKLKRYSEALTGCERAIALRPDFAKAHRNRGITLWRLDRHLEALAGFDQAIALRPRYAEAYNNKVGILHDLGRYQEALVNCDRALALSPDFAAAHSNRGNILRELARYDEALASCARAIALRTDFAEAYVNQGNILNDLRRYEEAVASCDQAIALRPGYAEAYNNRGNVFRELGRWDQALASYDQAIAFKPDYAEALNNKSGLLLLMGNFQDGWTLNEWRWKTAHLKGKWRNFPQPQWLGTESVTGKTLLLHAEQGLGDTIQLVRYVPLVEALGARVILEAPAALIPLLRTLKGGFHLVAQGETLPDFDAHCPLMSLPLAFNTTLKTIPAENPYLFADPLLRRAWQARLGEKHRPRIGLAWSGNPANKNDRNRSLPLSLLMPYLSSAFDYHVLQKEIRPADEAVLRDNPHVHRHAEALTDFAETAALILEMDLVLSVDTSIAHVAGALGQPVWVLLPYSPDWRWLTERSDSPWYPTAHLFRQRRPSDWGGVLVEMTEALGKAGLSGTGT